MGEGRSPALPSIDAVGHALQTRPMEYAIQPIRTFGPDWSRALRLEWLMRPQRHFGLSPTDLVNGAASLGLTRELDRRVIVDAIEFLAITPGTRLAVNILHASAADRGFAHFLLESLDERGVAYERLCLEITEHGSLSNLVGLLETSDLLRRSGIRIGLDDVGSGCHAVASIIQLGCLDYIKLDRRLISDALTDPICRNQLVRLLHAVRTRGLELVAEGIENDDHVRLALALKISVGQGYYWDPPRTVHCARPIPQHESIRAADVHSLAPACQTA